MDQEQLFTAAKWEILTCLSTRSMSPLELSAEVSTSIANISQSLRFLEMAGIVKSRRVPNRDKGQPRIIYSIVKDIIFPIIVSKGFASKELMDLEPHRKSTIKSWYYPIKKFQPAIEKFLWEIEPQFTEIKKITVVSATDKTITFSIQPESIAKKIMTKNVQVRGNNYNTKIVAEDSQTGFILHTSKSGNIK